MYTNHPPDARRHPAMTSAGSAARGLVRCGICHRRMQGAAIRQGTYYRCLARSLAPGSPVLADHPRTVNLREDNLLDPLNRRIAKLFAPEHVDNTVAELLASQQLDTSVGLRETAAKRLADAEARLRRHQAAIEAGVEPVALVEAINRAHAEKEAARAELAHTPAA